MPTNSTDTDNWVANVQRPNNGELADSGSLSQGFDPLTQRSRYLYNRSLHGNYDAHRYGAVGSGSVNDYPAIASAVAAAVADGGGVVWLRPGKSYRLDSELALDGRVSICAMKGLGGTTPTRLVRNHAGRLIKVDNAIFVGGETASTIDGVSFSDAAANSQAMIDAADGSLSLVRCYLLGNAAFTGGPLLRCAPGVRDSVRLRECFLFPDTGQSAISHEIGTLDVSGTTFVLPATYSTPLISINSLSAFDPALGMFRGNDFDCTQLSSGNGTLFNLAGSYWSMTATGNTFGRSNGPVTTGFAWAAGGERRLNVHGNVWDTITTRYSPAGDPLSNDSDLELIQHRDDVQASASTVFSGVENFRIRITGTSSPTITFPPILFRGQRLNLVIYNLSGSSWGFSIAASPVVVKETQSTVANGQIATGTFDAIDLDGSGPVWVQIGKWGYASP